MINKKNLFLLTVFLIAAYSSYVTLTIDHVRSHPETDETEVSSNLLFQKNHMKISDAGSDEENEGVSNSYHKNGMIYIEPPNKNIHGGLAQHYQQLKLEADSGNAQSAYLLGINLSKCLSAPLDIDAASDLVESFRNVLPTGGRNYNEFVSAAESTIMQDYYYCEGITQEQRIEFFYYIKMAIAGGDIYAASSELDFYSLVESTNETASSEEKHKLVEKYIVEYRRDMREASERGSVPAMFYLAQSHVDEYSILKNDNALAEALKYYLVLSDYSDSEFQSYIQERIKLQRVVLMPEKVIFAEEESKKLKLKIEKNKTIYKFKVKNH